MSNKLQQNQLYLLRHLAQYLTLDYISCLNVLDTDKTGDRMALSYAFRPLTKNGYVKKHKDGSVVILANGRNLFPAVKALVTLGGGAATMKRLGEISCMAALLREHGYESTAGIDDTQDACFIPSPCWRKIRNGILSTTRFLGILLVGEHRLAVYNIENGKIDWQLRAERSLFHNQYREYDTSATGMLWVCDAGQRTEVAKNIIRQTMWQRRQLIGNDRSNPRDKPVRYSHAPIRIARQYEHVYLTTPEILGRDIVTIGSEEATIKALQKDAMQCSDSGSGDYEVAGSVDSPRCRYYINSTTDLLKFVYFFTAAKDYQKLKVSAEVSYNSYTHNYALVVRERDLGIARMYSDVMEMEEVEIYVLNNRKDT